MTDFEKNLADIVDAALSGDQAARGKLLRQHPGYDVLIKQADNLRSVAETIPVSGSAAAIREEFLSHVDTAGSPRSVRFPLYWRTRPLWQKLMVPVAATVLSFGGVATASNGSLPGGTLYPVKIAVEQARVATALSDRQRGLVLLQLAERRLREMSHVAKTGDRTALDQLSHRFHDDIDRAVRISTTIDPADGSEIVDNATSLHRAEVELLRELDAALRSVPLTGPGKPADQEIGGTDDSTESVEKERHDKEHPKEVGKGQETDDPKVDDDDRELREQLEDYKTDPDSLREDQEKDPDRESRSNNQESPENR